jgi:8-oxo-dGTP pyrophosphatase MutT (NUDIX family)
VDRRGPLFDRIAVHRPRRIPFGDRMRTAAVAAIIGRRAHAHARENENASASANANADASMELLLIRRPRRLGDRWSGNIAFPGGLVQPGDADAVATAVRETHEEVGVTLGAPIGRLSELLTATPGRLRPMRVVPFVFRVEGDVALTPDPREVDAAFWIPWPELATTREHRGKKRIAGIPVRVPLITLTEGTLWGLTLMMVRELRRVTAA